MKKLALLALPFIFLIVALFFKNLKKEEKTDIKKEEKIEKEIKIGKNDFNSKEFFINYVINVMINGSDLFKLPSGAMEGGYVTKDEARKIAEYLAFLQGFKDIDKNLIKEGSALFYGNCTGCHGIEGKGQKGYFPDLTRRPLLGIEILKKKAK